MTRKIKLMACAAAAATMAAASPAAAQYGRYDPYYDRDDRGFDVATGIAVVGTIANILNVFRGGNQYGYGQTYGYGQPYGYGQYGYNYQQAQGLNNAVQGCGREAQRYAGGGRVEIRDVDRDSRGRFRVHGVVDNLRSSRGYGGYGYYSRAERDDFSCLAAANGRVLDFDY